MIKYNNKTINDWYFDDKNIIKVYKNNAICYYRIVSGGVTPPAPVPYDEQYLTIESLEDNNTVYLKASSAGIAKTVSASTDNGATWTEYTSSVDDNGTALATLNIGDKLLVKGENSTYATTTSNYNQFASTGQFEAKGNIMSLIYGDNFENQTELTGAYNFCSLFRNPNVVSAENLILPATTLANYCYQGMFYNCTSLTTAPELPATTLANSCYYRMFQNCTNLTTAPSVLPATTLAESCYMSMFQGCKNLTTAPVLPADTLAGQCYGSMFYNCKSLNYIKAMFTTTPNNSYTFNWVKGVASSGTFVKNAAATWNVTGTYGIPSGWSIVNA